VIDMPWVNTTDDEGLAAQMYSYHSDVLDAQFDVTLDHQGSSYFSISPVTHSGYLNDRFVVLRNSSSEFLAMRNKIINTFRKLGLEIMTQEQLGYKQQYGNTWALKYNYIELKDHLNLLLVMPVYDGQLVQKFFEIVSASDAFQDDAEESIMLPLLKIRSPWEYHARCHEYEAALSEAVKNKKQLELAHFCREHYFKNLSQLNYIKLAVDAYDACSTIPCTRTESLQLNRECVELCDTYLNVVYSEVGNSDQVDTQAQQQSTYSKDDCKEIEKSLLSALLSIDTERTPAENSRLNMLLTKMVGQKSPLKIPAENNAELVLTLAQQNVAQAQENALLRAQLSSMQQQQVSPASVPQSLFGSTELTATQIVPAGAITENKK